MKDQVVFVTGAARGIGAGVSKQLAARGARIALTGLEPDELAARAAELGPGHMVYELDVTDSDSVRSAVDAVIQKYGRIVDAGTAHPSWIDTDLVRESEANLKSFRLMRANLPWPLKATTPLETCASRARVRDRDDPDPLLAYVDGALRLDERADITAARCWVGLFAEAIRNPALFKRMRTLIDAEITTIQARSGERLDAHQAGAVLAFIIGALVLGAFAPNKTAGFAAPGLRRLIASMQTERG